MSDSDAVTRLNSVLEGRHLRAFHSERGARSRRLFLIVAYLGLGSCGGDDGTGPEEPVVASVAITPANVSLVFVGEELQLSAEARDGADAIVGGTVFAWTSSNTSVATVGPSGLVGAVANGEATISARAGGVTGTAEVTVAQVPVEVVVSPRLAVLGRDGTLTIVAVVRDAGETEIIDPPLLLISRSPDVASVDGTTITGIADGATDVVVQSGDVTDSIRVIVAGDDGIVVDGRSNIFGAGSSVLPPMNGSPGILPPGVSFLAQDGQVLTFSTVAGAVGCCGSGGGTNGPDGSVRSTNIESLGGISGIRHDGRAMFLVGVFLSDAAPGSSAPTILNFSNADDFTSISPELGQTFYIGDALTGMGSGSIQEFVVPDAASRLYLGFADAIGFSGTAGFYDDNIGDRGTDREVHD